MLITDEQSNVSSLTPQPVFPQETCPMGEDSECAYRTLGIGLGCQSCGKYVHPGDPGYVKLAYYHAFTPGFESLGFDKEKAAKALIAAVLSEQGEQQ